MGRLHSLFWFVAIVLSTSWIHRWSQPARLPGPHIQGLHDLQKINLPLFWPNQSTHKNSSTYSSIHPWDNANLHSDPGLTRPGETFSSIWSTPSTIFWRFSSKIITIITAIVTFRVTPLNDICYSTTQSAKSTTKVVSSIILIHQFFPAPNQHLYPSLVLCSWIMPPTFFFIIFFLFHYNFVSPNMFQCNVGS